MAKINPDGQGVTLKDLRLVKGKKRLIDADSRFKTLTEK